MDDEDEDRPEYRYEIALADVEHWRKLHYLFVNVLPTAVVVCIAAFSLWAGAGQAAAAVSQAEAVVLAILCLAVSCVGLVLGRSYHSIPATELPEQDYLSLAFRESQLVTILLSAAILGSIVWPASEIWTSRVLLSWIALVAGEQLVRVVRDWLSSPEDRPEFVPPLKVVLRQVVVRSGNPVGRLFEAIEKHLGVSFRSSWAIGFVRRAILPTVLLSLALYWGLSCLSMVGPSEMGIRETFGQIHGKPLHPGLHLKVPWPYGRVLCFDVKTVVAKPIGFVTDGGNGDGGLTDMASADGVSGREDTIDFDTPRAFLWSKPHAKEEFALVLGNGTEVVVVDAFVFYKIREDRQGFLDYAYGFQNPAAAMEGYAYRALMEHTRAATLGQVLSANRAEFAQRVEDSLRHYVTANRLGIDIVDVALINLHPPLEAAPDYLDVISARIDAERFQTEANAERLVTIQDSQTKSSTAISTAQVEAARRVGAALEESAEFIAVGRAYEVAPEAFRFRMRGDILSDALSKQPWLLIDKSFAGEYLDLRETILSDDTVAVGGK
jgi:regulator of protease activity HflC (stomatin/prohibitin superfamily)